MSLKDELLGAPRTLPPYQLVLPAGWREYAAHDDSEQALLEQASARLRSQHRPDLNAQLLHASRDAFARMRQSNTVAFYLQTDAPEDQVMPISLTASRLVAPDGASLDGQVSELIRNRGAEPFNDDMVLVRWQVSSTRQLGEERVGSLAISYLAPIPGTMRREGLQFVAVILHPVGLPADDPGVAKLAFLSDTIMSTFAWMPA
jgi:hypothetical protein